MPVHVKPEDSLLFRYLIRSFFCPNSGSNCSTVSFWLLAENSEGMKRLTPAWMAASTSAFCSLKPVAPTAEITASCPWKTSLRELSEKSVFRTVTPGGKITSLVLREITVMVNLFEATRLSRIILPMFPLA